jgi:DNA-binding IclR family transcriptional regulator
MLKTTKAVRRQKEQGMQNTSIEKAVLILKQLAIAPYEFKTSELARRLGMNRSSVYRILQALKDCDLVICDKAGEHYKVGPEMYHIGTTYLYNNNFHSKLVDILSEISEIIKESVGMAIKDGDKIMSLLEIEVHQPMKLNDVPGRYYPPNKGNYGKTLMAYQDPEYIERVLSGRVFEKTFYNTLTTKEELLQEYALIRSRGYSLSIDELGIDILGVGVPIFGESGKIKACVAVGFYRSEGWEDKLQRVKDLLLGYQNQIERNMP